MKKCKSCGYENEANALFCENCGMRLEQQKAPIEPEKKNKPRLIWLWIVLLAIGIAAIAGVIILMLQDDKEPEKTEDDIVVEIEPEVETEDDTVIVDTLPEIIINTPTPLPGTPTPTPEITTPENQEEIIVDTVPENVPGDIAAESQDIEEQIQDIRDIYYGIQYNLDDYVVQDGGGGTTRYLDSQGNIVKISAEKGTYGDIATGDDYAAEYYYEIVNGKYHLRFVFVWGKGEEYRIYLDRSNKCIRFIDPAGVIYDNEAAVSQLSSRTDLSAFCSQAQREIAMAFNG